MWRFYEATRFYEANYDEINALKNLFSFSVVLNTGGIILFEAINLDTQKRCFICFVSRVGRLLRSSDEIWEIRARRSLRSEWG